MKNSRLLLQPIKQPVFIIGAPRSGTTFIGNCISSIPTVCYFHEPAATKCAAAHVYLHPQRWSSLGRYYEFQYRLLLAGGRQSANHLAEKTPRNCFIVNFLYQIFKDARFIHIIRDGRDSAWSNAQKEWLDEKLKRVDLRDHAGYRLGSSPQFWTEPNRKDEFGAASKLKRCAWAWRRYTESAMQQLSFIPPNQKIEIRYEEMTSNPGHIGDCISSLLGLAQNESTVLKNSLSAASKVSVGKAKRELSQQELNEIESECGELLCQLNYG